MNRKCLLDLEILCANHDIDILCVTETWLSTKSTPMESSLITLPGYQSPFRRDRSGRRGGGVAMYVRNGITATVIPFQENIESSCVKVSLSKRRHIYIVTVYHPPGSDTADFISNLQTGINKIPGNNTVCIVGDLNAKHSHWWSGQATDETGGALFDFASSNGLIQLVQGATRNPLGAAAAQLDLMFLNDISSVEACVVLPQLSDHCPTLLSLNIQPLKQQVARRSFLDIKSADFCGLNRCLAELDWSPVLDVDNPDTAVQIWNEILSVAMHKFIPEKQVSTRSQNKPWYSPHLCRIRRQRDRLYKRSKNRTTDHHLSVLYRRVRNWFVAELRYAEKLYYRRISLHLSKKNLVSDAHKWWKIVKKSCGLRSSECIPPLSVNGRASLTASDKAESLNTVFAQQCSAPAALKYPKSSELEAKARPERFTFTALTTDEVFERLSKLHTWKAPGADGVSHHILKSCPHAIAEPLCHIFNLSLRTGSSKLENCTD